MRKEATICQNILKTEVQMNTVVVFLSFSSYFHSLAARKNDLLSRNLCLQNGHQFRWPCFGGNFQCATRERYIREIRHVVGSRMSRIMDSTSVLVPSETPFYIFIYIYIYIINIYITYHMSYTIIINIYNISSTYITYHIVNIYHIINIYHHHHH